VRGVDDDVVVGAAPPRSRTTSWTCLAQLASPLRRRRLRVGLAARRRHAVKTGGVYICQRLLAFSAFASSFLGLCPQTSSSRVQVRLEEIERHLR
jgi:hypothetical protein